MMKFILVLKCLSKKEDIFSIEKIVEFDDSIYNSYQKKYKPYELKVVEVEGSINPNKFYKIGDLLCNYNEKHERVDNRAICIAAPEEESEYYQRKKNLELEDIINKKYIKEEFEKHLKDLENNLLKCYNVHFNHQNRFYVEETLSFLTHVYLLDFDTCEVSDINGNYVELGKTDYHKLYLELFNKKQRFNKIMKEHQNKLKESKTSEEFLDLATKYKHDLTCMINNENKRDEEKK